MTRVDDGRERTARTATWFRPDIDGLRAVAILLIVAFHADLPGWEGGFIGVDVFFVISGYLITRKLVSESEGEGRVRLLRFWAKRIRRLVPALTLMVVVVLVASAVVLLRIQVEQVAREGLAAAFYVSNILFAREAQDYFAPQVNESPFLHTWSLGVEEQFYLLVPLAVSAAVLLVGRRPRLLRPGLVVGFVVVIVASFALNLVLTDRQSPWAFFSLPTRAWEFAVAGLLAVAPVPASWRVRGVQVGAGAAGLAMLGFGVLQFSPRTPYPGTAALVPVVATVLLIYAGMERDRSSPPTFVSRSLGSGPMQWIGRLSYSWYLWHWPFVILVVAAVGDDTVPVKVVAVCASLPVAYLAHRAVENPLRFSPRLVRSTAKTFALGGGACVVVAVVVGALAVAEHPPPAGSLEAKLETVQAEFGGRCPRAQRSASGVAYCATGDRGSDRVVMLVGDSHAQAWTDALGRAAEEAGLRLAVSTAPGCPPIPVRVRSDRRAGASPAECAAERRAQQRLIDDLDPVAVVLAQGNVYRGSIEDSSGQVPDDDAQVGIWAAALDAYLGTLSEQGVQPMVILDNPNLDEDPNRCITREKAIDPCVPSRAEALAEVQAFRDAERAVIDRRGAVVTFDPLAWLCDDSRCPLEVDGHLVYRDQDHLGAFMTDRLRPQLVEMLGAMAPDR